MNLSIRYLQPEDVGIIARIFVEQGWRDRTEILRQYIAEQARGERVVLVAEVDGLFTGYGTTRWQSDYPPFAENGIAEISDLNVPQVFQRQGIARALLDKAESLIFERSQVAGIGVGMFTDYGAAQRLYAKRGYVPDGRGLFYKGQHVKEGQTITVDHDLILYLTKTREES